MKEKGKAVAVILRLGFTALFTVSVVLGGESAARVLSFLAVRSAESYLPHNITLPQTQRENTAATVTAAAATTEAVKPVAELSGSLAVTDSDIIAVIEKAKLKSESDKKDGEIYEYTFTDDGVTDSYGCVRVKNTNNTKPEIEKRLAQELTLDVRQGEPLVLIYHSHTTETYQLLDRDYYAEGFLSRSNNEALNMVRVGKAVKQELEKMGYTVIHDTAIYDNPYTGAYYRSMDAAQKWLERYPSIQITIDLHRDAIQNDEGVKTKPTAVINGKKAAQIMIISGCQEEGNGITDLPEWEKNLTFGLKLQQSMESMYPGLTRPLFFCARSYNMGLTPCSLLVEVGTDANTLDEAVYSGKMLGRALGNVIAGSAP